MIIIYYKSKNLRGPVGMGEAVDTIPSIFNMSGGYGGGGGHYSKYTQQVLTDGRTTDGRLIPSYTISSPMSLRLR